MKTGAEISSENGGDARVDADSHCLIIFVYNLARAGRIGHVNPQHAYAMENLCVNIWNIFYFYVADETIIGS